MPCSSGCHEGFGVVALGWNDSGIVPHFLEWNWSEMGATDIGI